MKRISICAAILALMAFCNSDARAQSGRDNKKTTIIGTVIGFDSMAALGNITSAPQSQLLIVRIDKPVRKERAKFIKVIYEYFASESTYAADLTSGKEKRFKFSLLKDRGCDVVLKEVKYAKSTSLDGGTQVPVLRLRGSNVLENLPESTHLPCYILKSNGVTIAR